MFGQKWLQMGQQRLQVCGGGGQAAVAGGQKEEQAARTMLQFYTEETPGLRLSPNVVLIMSIGFIAFVGILHVLGKLYLVPRSS